MTKIASCVMAFRIYVLLLEVQ